MASACATRRSTAAYAFIIAFSLAMALLPLVHYREVSPARPLALGLHTRPLAPALTTAKDMLGLTRVHIPPWLFAAHFGGSFLLRGSTSRPPTSGLSQSSEDVNTYNRYFYGMTGGMVLESGALDGQVLSVSHMFEMGARWRAILIEAAPTNFDKIAVSRPNAFALNFVMCGAPRMVRFLDGGRVPHKDYGTREALGGIIASDEEMAHLTKDLVEEGVVDAATGNVVNSTALDAPPYTLRVPCFPPAALLRWFGVRHLDLWVLDVEGGEADVLRAFDFSPETGVTVDVLIMEANDEYSPDFEERIDLLARAGMRRDSGIKDRQNFWFVRDGFVGVAKPEAL